MPGGRDERLCLQADEDGGAAGSHSAGLWTGIIICTAHLVRLMMADLQQDMSNNLLDALAELLCPDSRHHNSDLEELNIFKAGLFCRFIAKNSKNRRQKRRIIFF